MRKRSTDGQSEDVQHMYIQASTWTGAEGERNTRVLFSFSLRYAFLSHLEKRQKHMRNFFTPFEIFQCVVLSLFFFHETQFCNPIKGRSSTGYANESRCPKPESLHYQTCLQHSSYNINFVFQRFHILISMLCITSCILVDLWNTAIIVIANNANNSDSSIGPTLNAN